MNKPILEIAKQAGLKFPSETDLSPPEKKFAELIVKECFKAAMIESKGHMNPIDLMKRMKERVGVEE